MNFKVKVYTDGSCLGNPGPGGYGVYLQKFDERGTINPQDPDADPDRPLTTLGELQQLPSSPAKP